MVDQRFSRLLQLPRELRDEIYKHLFKSTRLTFGKRYFQPGQDPEYVAKWLKPAPNALAILRTCRQVHAETKDRWIGEVLFNFERTKDMLDKLDSLSPFKIASIRHVRVRDKFCWIPLPEKFGGYSTTILLHDALWLLPHLRLDTLTVLGPPGDHLPNPTLLHLIRLGHGWKELRYLAQTSEILTGSSCYLWQKNWKLLRDRDGANSGASITIYRAMEPELSVLDSTSRRMMIPGVNGLKDDEGCYSGDFRCTEWLVVVKRGQNADIIRADPTFDFGEGVGRISDMSVLTTVMEKMINHDWTMNRFLRWKRNSTATPILTSTSGIIIFE